MKVETCPHFQTRIEPLSLELTTALLPVRRCLLAERMIVRIRPLPESGDFVSAFVRDPGSEVPSCLYGPDLDAIEHGKCTKERCETSCSPSYRQLLESFQAVDPQPPGCDAPIPGADAASSSKQ